MLVIRFARRGRKKNAFFDLVVAEKQKAVQKKIVQKLGYLDPLWNKGEGKLVFDEAETKKYIKSGAQLSQRTARELSKAGIKEAGAFIKNRPTKPKKEEKPKEDSDKSAEKSTNEADKPTEEVKQNTEPTKSEENKEAKVEKIEETNKSEENKEAKVEKTEDKKNEENKKKSE